MPADRHVRFQLIVTLSPRAGIRRRYFVRGLGGLVLIARPPG